MNQNKTLTLVMIVKNEEKGLAAAIQSAKPYVQDIIVAIDEKSTDRSGKIAIENGAIVKTFQFSDNFSAARNFAAIDVKTDYILFLDGHEILEKADNLQEYLNSDKDVILVPILMENGTIFFGGRIYKRGLNFVGRIHERVEGKTSEYAKKMLIKHNRIKGQNPDSISEREEQRIKHMDYIMKSELQDNPRDTRVLFHLALFYHSHNNYKSAKKYTKLFLKYSDEIGGRWYLCYCMAIFHYTKHHYLRALFWTQNCMKENPKRWEICHLRGLIFRSIKKYDHAVKCFVESLNENCGFIDFLPLQRNLSQTFNFIGECLFSLGKFYEAGEAFAHAASKSYDRMFSTLLKRRSELMFDMFKNQKK